MTTPKFTPTPEFLDRANKHIRATLLELRPRLLESSGNIEHELKGDQSLVTAMDFMVENHLHATLTELEPSIGFAGEETGQNYDQPAFWLVDPIDGTEPFTRGLPVPTTEIALIHDGEPVLAVIYNFVTDEFYLAIKGQGATKNGHRIHVSARTMAQSYVKFSPRLKNHKMYGFRDRLREKVRIIPEMGATGYMFACIAEGKVDGIITYDTGGGPWDFAPGVLLIREAGGRAENLFSSGYDFRDLHLVASNAIAFDDIKAFVEAEITAAYDGNAK